MIALPLALGAVQLRVADWVPATAVGAASTATTQTVTGLTAGTAYTFTVAATNAVGTGSPSPASNAVTPNSAPAVTSTSPPNGRVGTAYSYQLTVSGGTTPYTWSVSTGSLPAGLSLSSGGLISGTPTTAGSSTFTVRASDASGSSATQSLTITVTDRPATPAAPTATAGTTSAVVNWTAPSNNGSSITGYTLTPYLNGTAQTPIVYNSTATTQTITGLTAGSTYTFTVAATNANGTSAASPQSSPTVPYDVPGAPSITSATAGTRAATLTWSAPSSNNGSAVTGYVVTPYVGSTAQATQTFGTGTTQTITGLTAGTAYTFTVAAQNAAGTGPVSAASNSVTPNAAPSVSSGSPPTGRVGVAYSHQFTVSGGTSPYSWSVSAGTVPAGLTLSSGGLLSGTPTTVGSTTFTVRVLDASGSSATQAVTLVVIDRPATPGAPTATAGTTSAAVSWTAPATNGSAITSYTLTPYLNGTAQTAIVTGSATTSRSVTGLTAGGVYTFTVAATNAAGTSAASQQSAAAVPYDVPAAPSTPSATAGTQGATLTWSAPSSTNGSAVTGYLVTPYIGSTAQTPVTFSSTGTTQTITGLTGGTAYTFTVAAQNAAGTGPASAASNSVTPNAAPSVSSGSPPTGRVGVAYSYQFTVAGGTSPYSWSVSAGTVPAGLALSSGGLLSGTPTTVGSSTFTVRVLDASGATATQAVNVAVIDRPATPVAPTATAGMSSAAVSWTAPANNGGTITGYTLTPYLNGTAQPAIVTGTTGTSRTVTGLTAGGSYTFTVAATNAAGTSAASPQSAAAVPYDVPAAPSITSATASTQAVTLTWTAPAANGSAITGYVVTPYIGGTAQPSVTFAGTATTQTITGLAAGTAYTFTVAAQNAVGTGPASGPSAGVTPNAAPTLTFANPPPGEVNVAYSQQLVVNGGSAPFTWSVASGALPPGVALGASSGVLSGTPTTAGTYGFTVQVTDASGASATRNVSLVIAAQPSVAFSPVAGEVGVAYSQQPTVTGGTSPFTWALSAGSLPAGVTLNTSSGLVSGTPTASGTFSVAVRATDSFNQSASRTASIVIAAAPTLTSVPPSARQGVPYSYTLATTAGSAPFSYSVVTGSLPAGLALSSTGVLAGTPTTQGTSSFTVRSVDANGQTANDTVSLLIDQPPIQLVKTASATSVAPGGTITFTLTATNVSSQSYGNTHVYDPLSDVVDDATYNADATASVGTVAYSSSTLDWSVALNGGQSATLTYTVTVANPDTGNKVLTGTVDGQFASTSCSSGQRTSGCTATVTVSGLSIVKTASASSTTPGGTVTFSIAVTNSGQTPLTGATLTDTLAAPGVLDDAAYNGNGTATTGSVSYANSALTWTGNLAVGASATITYSVTVADPDTGNRTLSSTIVSSTAGNSCPSGNPAGACSAPVTVLVPALSIQNTLGASTAIPGATVTSSVTLSNTGQTDYAGITVNVALAAAVDDVTLGGATATAGTISFNPTTNTVVWTGSIAVGATVTINLSGTVRNPDPGDRRVTTVASSSAAGSTCPAGSTNAACTATVQVLVPQLTIAKSANVSTTTPGQVVGYTVVVTNSGQTDYTGATFSDSLTGVLDDATYNNDAARTSGTVSSGSTAVNWTGDLAVGASATITYSVTVGKPDPGDRSLTSTTTSTTPFNNCTAGSTDPRCTSTVSVLLPGLFIHVYADATSAVPGQVVHYRVHVENTGQTTYTNATVHFNWSGMFDDAIYNFDGAITRGSIDDSHTDGTAVWTLSLAPGESADATPSYTVVDPALGNRSLDALFYSDAEGSSCPTPANAGCSSSIPVLVPGLTITKTVDHPTVTPGDQVHYTMTVQNSGQTSYPAANLSDDLSAVLTDSTFDQNAQASVGAVSTSGAVLSWSGALAPGDSAVITYSVTVLDPDPGDKRLINTVTSTSAGSNCGAGSTDAGCTATVNVAVPGLTIAKTADRATTVPGGTVTYSVTVTNSGATPYTGATFSDALGAALDDAAYGADATASTGTVTYAASTLSWSGNLAVGASATIRYSVTVNQADVGDDLVSTSVTSTTRGNNCPAASPDTRCTATVPVARLTLVRNVQQTTTTPGSVVHLPVVFTNTGQVPYSHISVQIPRADSSDDVFATGDDVPSSGTLVRSTTTTDWTGDIPVGGQVTISFDRTVKNPDTGNRWIRATLISTAPGNNCPSGGTDPRCSMAIHVLIPQLTITKAADKSAVGPGAQVGYTVTVHNTGETPYTGAVVRDAMAAVLDDATYDANAVADSGSLLYSGSTLTWTGDLTVGQSVVISYSVTARSDGPGDKVMVNTVSSDAAGSTCTAAAPTADCRSTVIVLTRALTIAKSANVRNATLGSTVTYTVVVTNTGQTPYTSAQFSDSLAGVLDDASINASDVQASGGTASYADGTLSWAGALAPGSSATITYPVTIGSTPVGDGSMANTVTSSTLGSNCPAGGSDSRCTATVTVTASVAMTFTKTADVQTTAGGQQVHYSVTATNASESTIANVTVTDPLAGILDDASLDAPATATSGTVQLTGSNLVWTGDVAAGATVTISYSVTVNQTVASGADQVLRGKLLSSSPSSGNNCLSGSSDPRCTSEVPVAALLIQENSPYTTARPGDVLAMSAQFTNTGQVPYEGISISIPGAMLLDDAAGLGDQTASSGTFSITPAAGVWTGSIPVGGVVTVSAHLRVLDPPTGDKILTSTWQSDAAGSNCAAGSTDPRCSTVIAIQVPKLTITKSASTSSTVPGGTVGYTITILNNGESAYTGATVGDTLAGVLDDADYNGDAVASLGQVTYGNSALTWTGDLPVGQTATITYSVTAHSPAAGDKAMTNTAYSAEQGSTCTATSATSACVSTVSVLTPALTVATSASAASTTPGAPVTFTVTATNTGQTSYPNAGFSVPLAGVLDDAVVTTDPVASRGTAAVAEQTLTWSGALAPGQDVTVTYTVTVNRPDTGNHLLAQTVTSLDQGSTCQASSTDATCTVSVPVASLQILNTADVATTKPTGVVTYHVTFTNSGQVPYTGITVNYNLVGAVDDAVYNGDAVTDGGSLTVFAGQGRVSWTGNIAVGQTVTITGSMTVKNPYPGTADRTMRTVVSTSAPASNCASASTDTACISTVTVLLPGLTITKAASVGATTPGSVVTYTITVTNSGETPYTGATVSDPLNGVLDDASYGLDALATQGTASYANSTVSWTGDLAVGQSAVITYSVTAAAVSRGDKVLFNPVMSDELGSSCPTGSTNPGCASFVPVLVPALQIAVTADHNTATRGDVVGYTVTIANTGQTPYQNAVVGVNLSGVLADASYGGNAQATLGAVAYTQPTLTWTGDLNPGQTAVVSYTVTVAQLAAFNSPQLLTSTSSSVPGSSCPTGSPCVHTVAVLRSALAISTSADAIAARPGQLVSYTVTIENTGETSYQATTVTTDLTGVLDDANFLGPVTATSGAAGYTAPSLSWTGDLAPGSTVTLRYGARVKESGLGDQSLSNTVVSNAVGSSCPTINTSPATPSPACSATVDVQVPQLSVSTSASVLTTTPGSTVTYTINVTNSGETAYLGATVTDSLANLVTEAAYNADAAVTLGGGTVGYSGSTLTWTGDLAIGASATITFSVRVNDPATGDRLLTSSVSSPDAGSTCPVGGTGAACTTSVPVLIPQLTIEKSASTSAVVAGGSVSYTVTVSNTGETAYAPATFTDSLTQVLDDADYAGNATADVGTVSYANATVSWSGPLAVGATATITYAVNTHPSAGGDHALGNAVTSSAVGSTCAGGTEVGCHTTTTVLIPALSITKTANATHVVAGAIVQYTITASNTGQAGYPAASVTDSLDGLLAHASYDADATSTRGSLSYTGGTLTWTGGLPVGQSVIISYSVTVNPTDQGDAVLTNQVASDANGSTCPPASTSPSCTTSTAVDASTLSLSGLTSSFRLDGPPGSAPEQESAVVGSVTTNNLGGYSVTVQSEHDSLVGRAGNSDTIPVARLSVRESGSQQYEPLSATAPRVVAGKNSASAPSGDVVSNDYRVDIPDVNSDDYSTTLDYIVTAQ